MFSISKCPQEEAEKLSADWNKVSFKDIILAKFLGNVGTSIFYDRMKVNSAENWPALGIASHPPRIWGI